MLVLFMDSAINEFQFQSLLCVQINANGQLIEAYITKATLLLHMNERHEVSYSTCTVSHVN